MALDAGIAGIIATNTTLARDGLRSRARRARPAASPARRSSPAPPRSSRACTRLTEGRLPLIGVGGVASAADAYAKIRAGASAVQLYPALVYDGLGLVPRLLAELDALLARDGFATVAEAVERRDVACAWSDVQ